MLCEPKQRTEEDKTAKARQGEWYEKAEDIIYWLVCIGTSQPNNQGDFQYQVLIQIF